VKEDEVPSQLKFLTTSLVCSHFWQILDPPLVYECKRQLRSPQCLHWPASTTVFIVQYSRSEQMLSLNFSISEPAGDNLVTCVQGLGLVVLTAEFRVHFRNVHYGQFACNQHRAAIHSRKTFKMF